jgi:hypothetical protein
MDEVFIDYIFRERSHSDCGQDSFGSLGAVFKTYCERKCRQKFDHSIRHFFSFGSLGFALLTVGIAAIRIASSSFRRFLFFTQTQRSNSRNDSEGTPAS